jgi:hypothetical protein
MKPKRLPKAAPAERLFPLVAVSLLAQPPPEKTLRRFFQPAGKTVLSDAGVAVPGD